MYLHNLHLQLQGSDPLVVMGLSYVVRRLADEASIKRGVARVIHSSDQDLN